MKYLDKWTQTWRVHLKLYAKKLNLKSWRERLQQLGESRRERRKDRR